MPAILQRLWIQLTADKRRFGLLVVVIAVGLLMWARLIIVSHPPRTAIAGDEADMRPDTPQSTPESGSDRRELPILRVELAAVPARDPFRISSYHFPKSTIESVIGPDQGKSGEDAVEDSIVAAARREQMLRELTAKFKLEAVMKGNPMAVINGRTYRQGATIPAVDEPGVGFLLREVGDRFVVLEFDGLTFQIHMPEAYSDQG